MAVSTLKRKIAIVSILNELNDDANDAEAGVRWPRGPDRAWISARKNKGAFCNIFKELEMTDTEGFRLFMRMDIGTFNNLVNVGSNIKIDAASGIITATGVNVTGIVTAASFVGSGQNLTNLPAQSTWTQL